MSVIRVVIFLVPLWLLGCDNPELINKRTVDTSSVRDLKVSASHRCECQCDCKDHRNYSVQITFSCDSNTGPDKCSDSNGSSCTAISGSDDSVMFNGDLNNCAREYVPAP